MYKIKNLSTKKFEQGLLEEFLDFANKSLEIDKPYSVYFVDDKDNASDALGKTAMYNPSTNSVYVYVTDRHPKDVLRSVAHELMHHKQNCDGRLDRTYGEGTDDLEMLEREANEAGYLVRQFEDGREKMNEVAGPEVTHEDPKYMTLATSPAALRAAFYKRWTQKQYNRWKDNIGGYKDFIGPTEADFITWLKKDTTQNAAKGAYQVDQAAGTNRAMAITGFLDVAGIHPKYGAPFDLLSAVIKFEKAALDKKNYERFKQKDLQLKLPFTEYKLLSAPTYWVHYLDGGLSLLSGTPLINDAYFKAMAYIFRFILKFPGKLGLYVVSRAMGKKPEELVQMIEAVSEYINRYISEARLGNPDASTRESAKKAVEELQQATEVARSWAQRGIINSGRILALQKRLAQMLEVPITKLGSREAYDQILLGRYGRGFVTDILYPYEESLRYRFLKRTFKESGERGASKKLADNIDSLLEIVEQGAMSKADKQVLKSAARDLGGEESAAIIYLINMYREGGMYVNKDFIKKQLMAAAQKMTGDVEGKALDFLKEAAITSFNQSSEIFGQFMRSDAGAFAMAEALQKSGFYEEAAKIESKGIKDALKAVREAADAGDEVALKKALDKFNRERLTRNPAAIAFKKTKPKLETALEEEFLDFIGTKHVDIAIAGGKSTARNISREINRSLSKWTGYTPGSFVERNLLGRYILMDGKPVIAAGKVVPRIALSLLYGTKFSSKASLKLLPFLKGSFPGAVLRSTADVMRYITSAAEAVNGALIASVITYNRFFDIYDQLAAGGGGGAPIKGIGKKPKAKPSQQELQAAKKQKEGQEAAAEIMKPIEVDATEVEKIEKEVEPEIAGLPGKATPTDATIKRVEKVAVQSAKELVAKNLQKMLKGAKTKAARKAIREAMKKLKNAKFQTTEDMVRFTQSLLDEAKQNQQEIVKKIPQKPVKEMPIAPAPPPNDKEIALGDTSTPDSVVPGYSGVDKPDLGIEIGDPTPEDAEGEGIPSTGDKGKGGLGGKGGTASGEEGDDRLDLVIVSKYLDEVHPYTDRVLGYKPPAKKPNETEYFRKFGSLPSEGLVAAYKKLTDKYNEKTQGTGTAETVINLENLKKVFPGATFQDLPVENGKITNFKSLLKWIKNTTKVIEGYKGKPVTKENKQKCFASYRERVFNERFDKLTKGFTK